MRAVFFDVGNTLIYPYPSVSEVCRQVLAVAGHCHDLAAIDALMPLVDEYYEDRYRADDTFWTDEEETSGVWTGMYTLLFERLGIEEDAGVFARRVYDEFGVSARWRAYDDVLPVLATLRARGLKLGIISNWDGRLATLLGGLGIADFVEDVISSAEVGLRKPDPRIFELACERIGVSPSQAAHVGDHHYADILGAEAAGMLPVLIDRFSDVECRSTEAIATLCELEAALGL